MESRYVSPPPSLPRNKSTDTRPKTTADGRAYFTVPHLFSTSLCLRGAHEDDGWFFVHVEFLIGVGGDATGILGSSLPLPSSLLPSLTLGIEFPREPKGITRQHIAIEADRRLSFYLPPTHPEEIADGGEEGVRRQRLPEGVVDAPIVRLFNFLREFYLSLFFFGGVGWADLEFSGRDDVVVVSAGDPLVPGT
jgi:hypothetical protein